MPHAWPAMRASTTASLPACSPPASTAGLSVRRAPHEHNVRYFQSAAAAEQHGLRPCLRCRPELAPAAPGDLPPTLARLLARIDRGELAEGSLTTLAEQAGISERTLRRQFEQHLGASPKQVEQTRRLLLAKRLLTETRLPITDIAFAAGFASIRRFNDAWQQAYGLAPRALRRQSEPTGADAALTQAAPQPEEGRCSRCNCPTAPVRRGGHAGVLPAARHSGAGAGRWRGYERWHRVGDQLARVRISQGRGTACSSASMICRPPRCRICCIGCAGCGISMPTCSASVRGSGRIRCWHACRRAGRGSAARRLG